MSALYTTPLIGHRGVKAHAPENTFAGLTLAHAMGLAWVEVDARLSADGHVWLCHDDNVSRTTNAHGCVSRMTAAELERLDAGDGERVPQLQTYLDHARLLGLGVNVELKPEVGGELALARAVARIVAQAGCPVLVSSFSARVLAVYGRFDFETPRAWNVGALPPQWRRWAQRLGVRGIHVDQRRLTAMQARAIKTAGYGLAAYTVNDRRRARRLFGWGVDSVFTDDPGVF